MFFRRRLRYGRWIGACTAISTALIIIIVGSSIGVSAASSSGSSTSHSSSSVICPGTAEYIGDGECDDINNIEACRYDGGDCCSCTCTDTAGHNPCGEGGFNCLDPTAACLGEDDDGAESGDGLSSSSGQDTAHDATDGGDDGQLGDSSSSALPGAGLSSCSLAWTGDGFCDEINNTEECSYDGGDCCACTCLAGKYDCTGVFDCVDPAAATVDCKLTNGTSPSPSSGGASPDVVVSSGAASNGGEGDDDDEGAMSPCSESLVGDGSCDGANNNAECGYDGGDCCSGQNCDLCADPAAFCPEPSSLGAPTSKNENKNTKIVVGVGIGCVGLWSVVVLALRYRHLAREQKASVAASSSHTHAHARPVGIVVPRDSSAPSSPRDNALENNARPITL